MVVSGAGDSTDAAMTGAVVSGAGDSTGAAMTACSSSISTLHLLKTLFSTGFTARLLCDRLRSFDQGACTGVPSVSCFMRIVAT